MKYKGKKVEGLNTDILVLMKGDDRIVFKAQAIANYREFNELAPQPKPPTRMMPGGVKEENPRDPAFQKALAAWAEMKTDYSIIKSLEISEDIEWDTIDLKKPDTWKNWRKELEQAGFTEIEILRVMQLCTSVNCLDDGLLTEAKEAFLAEARQQEE